MDWKNFWLRLKSAMKEGAHKFSLWLQMSVKPELMDFLDKNKDLAIKVVTEVAGDLADSDGKIKRAEALHRITERLISVLPDVKISQSWINLLIEIAVSVLKAKGKI